MKYDPKRYRDAILRTKGLSDAARLVLLVMLDEHADARGYVHVSSSTLARRVGRDKSAITVRIGEARDAGWLSVVDRGRPPDTPATWALVIGREQRVRRKDRPLADLVDRLGIGEHVSADPIGEDVPNDERGARAHRSSVARTPETRASSVSTCPDPDSNHPRDSHATGPPGTAAAATDLTSDSGNGGNKRKDQAHSPVSLAASLTSDGLPPGVKPRHYGPCWKCRRTTQRYGPGGHRYCADCRRTEAMAA